MSTPQKDAIRALHACGEPALTTANLAALAAAGPDIAAAKALGRRIIVEARRAGEGDTLVSQLMNRYRLSTEEGVVLMCLAEALLRVPDSETANALIRDKIAGRHWTEGEKSGSMLVDMSAWGLSLGSATLLLDQIGSNANPTTILRRMIRRSGEPVIRQAAYAAMRLLGQQFVMGETIDKMSTELTDKAIESSRKSEELSSKPVLSTDVFVANVTKLKTHFETIESYRAQVKIEAEAEKKAFDDASTELKKVKVLNAKDQEELAKELSK